MDECEKVGEVEDSIELEEVNEAREDDDDDESFMPMFMESGEGWTPPRVARYVNWGDSRMVLG